MMSEQGREDRVLKWPTVTARQKACKDLCAHIAAGYSIECFPDADRKTIRYYAEQFPEDFPPERLEEAARRGLLEWEKIGKEGARGDLVKFNATAWTFNMKNRAGWRDRSEVEAWGVLGGADEAAKIEKLKPRSSAEIALGVMALLTREGITRNDDSSGHVD
ncbi:MAG: hypothetical protein K5905_21455 [Roseibium sp.]|uniref:hypothetical protein n=1 Tax=Roseibium sp. TaxID=1936156 RepID=UPI00261F588D|nr:hypothetical protein [Roseibium sp.]MCV0428031.1 hypothetical protein [Roseibium sp.]